MAVVGKAKLIPLIMGAVCLTLCLLVLKSLSVYSLGPIFGIYSLFVAIYVSSRVCAALFYRSYKVRAPTEWPSVSFIIPVFNEEHVIKKTISRCFECDYPADKLDVIAVDDGSTDASWDKIASIQDIFPRLLGIRLAKNGGKRNAMARAIRKSRSEIVIQLDSDSYLEKTSLKNLVSIMQDRKIAGVSAHTDPENRDENWLTKMQAAYYFVSFRLQKAAESTFGLVFCCSGCCSSYRREYLLPLLDEWTSEKHFGVVTVFGDDRSLTSLIIREGYNTAYADTAQAYTIVPNNLKQFFRQQARWKRSWVTCTARIARYIFGRDRFVATVYFFPQFVLTYLTPIVIVYSLFYIPLLSSKVPVAYLVGFFVINGLYVIYCSLFRSDIYRPYVFLWAGMSILLCSVTFPYAILTLRDSRWGTR